jgi:predicted ATPase
VLLIVTHRPEFEPPWIGRPYVAALTLNRLGEREIEALIDRVTGTNSLSESVKHDIIERTDGIPLFVEEMTTAMLEERVSNHRHQRMTMKAVAGSDQPCHIKRTHSPPRFMAQAIQERLEPSSELVFPIRRCVYHGRPSKSRPPMNH